MRRLRLTVLACCSSFIAAACGQACDVPVVQRDSFSATQVAFLVGELQTALSAGCYSVVSTSLVTCIPDLSLLSGCCTPNCERALKLSITPQCLLQFFSYICNNSTGSVYATYVEGVVKRCLPVTVPAAAGFSCPLNETIVNTILNIGKPENATQAAREAGANVTGESETDREYYAGCANEPPKLWPDFNGSYLFDALLAFARDVPQECLRNALSYLPQCYDDLTYQVGCCSLRCRAAIEKVPLTCLQSYLRSLCQRIPNMSKYFFNVASRCSNLNLTCNGFNPASVYFEEHVPSAEKLPMVAGSGGQCPLTQKPWPSYNAVSVTTQTLSLLANASAPCRDLISRITSACNQELGVQIGCCSYDCAIAMRSVPENCHLEYRALLCHQPSVAQYMIALADRCLGGNTYAPCQSQTSANVTTG